jgi:hypothetical protein
MKSRGHYPTVCRTLLFVCAFFVGSDAMAIEEASYTVLETGKDFELRYYEPYIVAETLVEGDFTEVGNEGFRRLFAYISGNNRSRQSLAMTAPVSQAADSEKIAMTAPVNQQSADGKWRIAFTMPRKYALATLPEPLDQRVVLRQVPGQLMAALKYSGTWSRSRYEEKKAVLEQALLEHGLKPLGEPVFARYNPPFMPWFLRRNEVLIPVERVPAGNSQ